MDVDRAVSPDRRSKSCVVVHKLYLVSFRLPFYTGHAITLQRLTGLVALTVPGLGIEIGTGMSVAVSATMEARSAREAGVVNVVIGIARESDPIGIETTTGSVIGREGVIQKDIVGTEKEVRITATGTVSARIGTAGVNATMQWKTAPMTA